MEKVKSLAWYWQLSICVGFATLLYVGVWYFYTSGIRTETQSIQDQVAQLQSKNQAAQIATQRINEFRSLYASKQQEYDELKVLLPEEQEITNVLQGLQDTAKSSNLTVMRFKALEANQQDFVMAKPVEVEVDSNFNNLRSFFEQMAKLQRIVSISDFSLKQLEKQTDDKTLHAQFLLTAYYASPENLTNVNAAPGQPGAKNGAPPVNGKPGTPPAAPAQAGNPVAPAQAGNPAAK